MKRRNLVMLGFALPSTNALSLANFQQISTGLVPTLCQSTYDGQIPVCTVADFQDGCSIKCQTALSVLAVQVTTSCITVGASANTLLGIVMRGGIIAALCPTADQSSTTTSSSTRGNGLTTIRPSFVTSVSSATKPPVSVPVTTSSTVVASTTEAKTTTSTPTTSATSQTQVLSSQTTTSVTSTSATITSTLSTVTPPVSSTSTDDDGGAESTTVLTESNSRGTQIIATSTNPADAETTSKSASNGSGGGSPFDIQSAAPQLSRRSALYVLVATVWTGVILRW
ncbi:hypothetical protein GLAREA_04535 [Glarea lozoyensis ATCC 20868]|uniref:Extracellular membrane protein CFEM domain-containing protein n=1 Tax=Glarea lozoyensis (strain ATCC 20868 / MF5171) TaxID=1116229 RepID=S3CRN8_GLAL2|nr:uncharacterized protein GLAREA_04535 [Glarea lozoyensis ATCC 20868]EPE27744.1 hypothetical protein GLAREA_04535 [Glarea lozoyensis ATCC 20868]